VVFRRTVFFGDLLRQLRIRAGMTQEQLAEAAGLSPRSISDLERGINLTLRVQTTRLLAAALGLEGEARAQFDAAARGGPGGNEPDAPDTGRTAGAGTGTRTLPRDIASFTGREPELVRLVSALETEVASGVVTIYAIDGMAGIGKTTFAVHAAHVLASRFPDGQIFWPRRCR
jgi:transcriptional regulator with XRE-family HTH domain